MAHTTSKPAIVTAHDGHKFACKHEGNDVVLTNEHGEDTRMNWEYAVKLLGLNVGADYDFVVLGRNEHDSSAVLVTSGKVRRFAAQWPCSGLPDDMGVIFTFESNGDLVDVEWFESWSGKTVKEPEGIDGGVMVALSQDAQRYMKANPLE